MAHLALGFVDPDWQACNECRALIDSGRRDALAQRSVSVWWRASAEALDHMNREQRRRFKREALANTRRQHDDFWRSRLGRPERIEKAAP